MTLQSCGSRPSFVSQPSHAVGLQPPNRINLPNASSTVADPATTTSCTLNSIKQCLSSIAALSETFADAVQQEQDRVSQTMLSTASGREEAIDRLKKKLRRAKIFGVEKVVAHDNTKLKLKKANERLRTARAKIKKLTEQLERVKREHREKEEKAAHDLKQAKEELKLVREESNDNLGFPQAQPPAASGSLGIRSKALPRHHDRNTDTVNKGTFALFSSLSQGKADDHPFHSTSLPDSDFLDLTRPSIPYLTHHIPNELDGLFNPIVL